MYSVMLSYGNSFAELSSRKPSRDEDNILKQIYEGKYVRFIILRILILCNIIRKYILKLKQ